MTLLEQCQKWHEDDQYEKIIEAILALPPEEQNARTDLELARAYNNLADPQTKEGQEIKEREAKRVKDSRRASIYDMGEAPQSDSEEEAGS